MRACWCTLAGTKHCDTCPNGPSRLNFNLDTRVDPTIKTCIDLDNPDFDPTKEMLEFLKEFDLYEQEEKRKSFERVFMPK